MYISKRSGMDHTVLPANTPCLPLLRKRSPDGVTPNWGKRHLIAAYYSSIDPEGMKLLSWLFWFLYSGRFNHISSHPSATGRAQDRESSLANDRCSTAVPRNHLPEMVCVTIVREAESTVGRICGRGGFKALSDRLREFWMMMVVNQQRKTIWQVQEEESKRREPVMNLMDGNRETSWSILTEKIGVSISAVMVLIRIDNRSPQITQADRFGVSNKAN